MDKVISKIEDLINHHGLEPETITLLNLAAEAQRTGKMPPIGAGCPTVAGSGFARCADCTDEMCREIGQCITQIYLDHFKAEEEYIAKGVCSDCGACSLKDAEGKCRPRALGDTGDVTCAGELLWEDQDEE